MVRISPIPDRIQAAVGGKTPARLLAPMEIASKTAGSGPEQRPLGWIRASITSYNRVHPPSTIGIRIGRGAQFQGWARLDIEVGPRLGSGV
jgi:hypothetical protein